MPAALRCFASDLDNSNLVATTAGTRLKATHLFAPSKFTNYIEARGTTIGGPIWSPTLDDNWLPISSEGDMRDEGYSGYVLSQLAVFSNDDLPTCDHELLPGGDRRSGDGAAVPLTARVLLLPRDVLNHP